MSNPLDTFGSTTLDANGKGSITLAPPSFQVWTVETVNVRTAQAPTATPVPQCTLYLGSMSDGNIIAQTWNGSRSTATGSTQVQPSQPLIVVWENGMPGTRATVSLNGIMDMR